MSKEQLLKRYAQLSIRKERLIQSKKNLQTLKELKKSIPPKEKILPS
ncbi:MAG: hypothetical protein ABSH06_05115 [Thermodesulfobacteriota bacterium]|jgi:hypothetical protein